jgi:hypothetical protein
MIRMPSGGCKRPGSVSEADSDRFNTFVDTFVHVLLAHSSKSNLRRDFFSKPQPFLAFFTSVKKFLREGLPVAGQPPKISVPRLWRGFVL